MRILSTAALCLGAIVCFLAGSTSAKSVSGDRVVVFLPTSNVAKQYSQFLDSLKGRGFDVSVRAASNTSVSIIDNTGMLVYDHVIVMSPNSRKIGANLSAVDFVNYVNSGGNLLVTASSGGNNLYQKLGAQFGITFEPQGSSVIDHSKNLKGANHTTIAASNYSPISPILSQSLIGKKNALPVYFKGIGHSYKTDNPLLIPVLMGNARTTYSAKVSDEGISVTGVPLTGKQLGLVSVFQTRQNSRVGFSGSTDMFANALMNKKGGANKQFVNDIVKWVLKEKSVLRETAHSHYLLETKEMPEHYRINNEIGYDIDMSVYHDDKWHPYHADDVQFEAIMLDPYIRLTLNRTQDTKGSSASRYHADIRLPDHYGAFTFRVNYKRTGYSNVDVQDTVAIWPLRHDEYPRFLSAAYPYYTGAFVMVGGFIVLCAAWMWSAEPELSKKTKKKSS